jgi:hypothetical protein
VNRCTHHIACVATLVFAGCTDSPQWDLGAGPKVTVSGKAFVFAGSSTDTLEGAVVAVAEDPASYQTTVQPDGTFSLEVPSGAPASFQLDKPGFFPNQSAALELGADGVMMLGFQAPSNMTVDTLSTFVRATPDPKLCQIATTVSRAGTDPYGGDALGEPGVVVTLDPPVRDHDAIYFYYSDGTIFPDPALTATSIDGGVVFTNIPPGEYTLTATKAGKQFTPVTIRCRAGRLVNAAPPHGLQEI